jgi:hypothetical protein
MAKAVPQRKAAKPAPAKPASKGKPAPALAAPKTLRIPITNVCDGSDYSAQILVGSQQVAANVILDTGSSTLAVTPSLYNAAADANVKATKLAQLVLYGTGGWIGPVVNTSMVLGNAANNVTLKNSPIAITDFQAAGNFGGSIDGIMGLAYFALNDAYKFKTPTYPWPFASGSYNSELQQFMHLVKSQKIPLVEVLPYFNELEGHHLTMNKFVFYMLRSWVNLATTNNSAIARDPLNNAVFVLGGGERETDLYTGSFVHVDVLHDVYYNTNLISVQVDGCPAVKAAPLQSQYRTQAYSNSIIDSGTSALFPAYDVFQSIMKSLESLNAKFVSTIRQASSSDNGISTSLLDLSEWPGISFILTGTSGKPVRLTCAPSTYWQTNYPAPGQAVFQIAQGTTPNQANQSILGLPLFNNYYTVFDRSQGKGNGVISFAPIKKP